MSETREKDRLDQLLAQWPLRERAAVDWDEMADSIVESALQSGPVPSVDDATAAAETEIFLAAPVGQAPEEGHNTPSPALEVTLASTAHDIGPASAGRRHSEDQGMSMSTDRQDNRRSLQDLAKLAAMTPAPNSVRPASSQASGAPASAAPSRTGEDSGLVDLSFATAAPASQPMAPPSMPASSSLFDATRTPAPVAPAASHSAPPPSVAPASFAPPQSAPPASFAAGPGATMPLRALAPEVAAQLTGGSLSSVAPASAPAAIAHAAPQKKSRAGVAVGALVALGAMAAAGGFVWMKASTHAEPLATTAQAEAPKVAADAPQPKAEAKAAEPVAVAQAEAPASDSVDPMALPEAHQASGGGAAHRGSSPAKAAAAPAAAAPAAEAPAAKTNVAAASKPAAKPAAAAPAPAEPSGPAGALGDAMRQAAGPTDPTHAVSDEAPKPKFAPGSVPSKPSQGAVTGAIGSVLPSARDCVGPDAPISRAAVVFGSSGAVKEVRVSGYAKGKKAEQCIVSAMQKASLPPFAEDSYTANVTIRH